MARAIHDSSRRARGPLVDVNCASLPESLAEAELFGHEKGAFTGADRPRKGHFEQAHGGTLFLDEVGELSPQLQPKLLRVLELREVRRIGGAHSVPVDFRLIMATHRNLEDMVRVGLVVGERLPPGSLGPADVLHPDPPGPGQPDRCVVRGGTAAVHGFDRD